VIWGLIPAADCDVPGGVRACSALTVLRSWFRCRILVSGFGSTKPAIYAPIALSSSAATNDAKIKAADQSRR
jgi:hypothetical protein